MAGLGGWEGLLAGGGTGASPSVLQGGLVGCYRAPPLGHPSLGPPSMILSGACTGRGGALPHHLVDPPTSSIPLLCSLISDPSAAARLMPCGGVTTSRKPDQGLLLPLRCSRAPACRALHPGMDPFLLMYLPWQFSMPPSPAQSLTLMFPIVRIIPQREV